MLLNFNQKGCGDKLDHQFKKTIQVTGGALHFEKRVGGSKIQRAEECVVEKWRS